MNAAPQDQLLFGHARRVINPATPVSLAGYFNLRMWTDVLDDILVQALVLRQGDAAAALLHFDLISVPNHIMAAVREKCADLPGLAPENILFTATHTHTAPDIRLSGKGASPEYNHFAIEQAAQTLHDAAADLQPAAIAYGKTADDRFAFNRRYWMKSGEVVTNPPRRDPNVVRPEGPTDPEIGLLGLTVDGTLKVLLANVVNHSDTTTGCKVSADWPGHLRRALETERPGLAVIPLVGASGNINHFDVNGPDAQSGPDVAKRIGQGCAESILPELSRLTNSGAQDLVAAHAVFTTGPREISDEELAEARDHASRYTFDAGKTVTSEDLAVKSPAALKYFADHLLKLAEDRRDRSFEVHALRLGDALLVTLPGEPFVENGLKIKQEFAAGRPTLIATLNQDAVYIPNRCNHGRGGYETMPRSSPYAKDTADRMLAATRNLLAGLLRGDR